MAALTAASSFCWMCKADGYTAVHAPTHSLQASMPLPPSMAEQPVAHLSAIDSSAEIRCKYLRLPSG